MYQSYPCFAKSLNQSDAFIQRHIGQSIVEELYERKDKAFDDLLLTHPAIVAVELAMLDLMEQMEIFPDYVAGNSLGEFAAGVAAGIWTKELALEAAIEQAKSIVQDVEEGGMLAVINESKSNLDWLISENQLYLASENFPNHFTLSGTSRRLDAFQKELKRQDIVFSRLPVTYPFHSPLIEPAKSGFAYYTFTSPRLNKPSKSFISGLYAKELKEIPDDYFWQVVCQPANFSAFVNYMEAIGPCLYLDLGPSGTSAAFVKYNLSAPSNSLTYPVMTPYKREKQQIQALKSGLCT